MADQQVEKAGVDSVKGASEGEELEEDEEKEDKESRALRKAEV